MSTKLPGICNVSPAFKGWTKPGPMPDLGADVSVDSTESVDALSGHFRIWQLKNGHRFSTDDILTAWYGTTCAPSVATVLDLGSGIGSVAMTAAWRLPHARFVTIEAQEISIALAKKSVAYNGLTSRFDLRLGDFRDTALADDERFDLILGSPPYWPPEDGVVSEHPQKAACRFEFRGDISDYCLTASQHLTPGGVFACVMPSDQLARVEAACEAAGLFMVRRRSVYFLEGEPPRIDLFAMSSRADLPERLAATWVEEPITIRCKDGSMHPQYAAIKLSFGFPP